jgi:ribose transport system permease protein
MERRMSETIKATMPLARTSRRQRHSVDQGVVVAALALLCGVVFSLALPEFLTVNNLLTAARNTTVLGILAIGMAVVVLARGIDLSIVVIMGVSSQFLAVYVSHGHSELLALLVAVFIAIALGLINGFLVSYVEMPALFVTLATALLFAGAFQLTYLQGATTGQLPPEASITASLANSRVLGIPLPVLILGVVALLSHIGLRNTILGRFIYAQGDSPASASLAGMPVRVLSLATYVVAALAALVAGVISVGSAGSFEVRASTSTAQLYDVLAIVVVGGVSLVGGRGSIFGVIAGTLLIGLLTNGMTLLNLDVIQQSIVKSLIVLSALLLDGFLHPRSEETMRPGEL